VGLARPPIEARAFLATLATLVGMILNFTPVDPVKAPLYWTAVIIGNGSSLDGHCDGDALAMKLR